MEDAPAFMVEVPCRRVPHEWRLVEERNVPPLSAVSLWSRLTCVAFGPMATERRWYCTRCRTFETTVEEPSE